MLPAVADQLPSAAPGAEPTPEAPGETAPAEVTAPPIPPQEVAPDADPAPTSPAEGGGGRPAGPPAPLPLGTIGVWKADGNAAAKIAGSLAAMGISHVPVKGARFPAIVCSEPDAGGQYLLQVFGVPNLSGVTATAAVGEGEGEFTPNE